MSKALALLSLALLMVCTVTMRGQNFVMLHYSVENGIPSNNVYNTYKDSKGYLWLCTDKGVARYNGISFETFTTFHGLPDNDIFFFKEDLKGRLWLATYNGELCYYKDGAFHTAATTSLLKLPFKKSFIKNIIIAPDSSVLIGFADRSKWIHINGKSEVLNLEKIVSTYDNSLLFINKAAKNRFEVAFDDRKLIIDHKGNVLDTIFFRNKKYKHSTSLSQQYLYTDDSIYTTREQSVVKMNKQALHAQIYHIQLFDGKVFYCTDKGLFIDHDIHVLAGHKVSGISQDDDGNYWVSTLDDGLYYLSRNFLIVKKYKNRYRGLAQYAFADSSYLFFTTNQNSLFRFKQGDVTCLFDYSVYNIRNKPANYQNYLIDRNYNYYGLFDDQITVVRAINSPRPKTNLYSGRHFNGGYKALFAGEGRLYLKRFYTIDYLDFSQALPAQTDHKNYSGAMELKSLINSKERVFGMAEDENRNLWYSTIDGVYKIVAGKAVYQRQFKGISLEWFEIIGDYLIGCTYDNKLVICNNINGAMRFDIVENQNCIWGKLYKLDAAHALISTNQLYRVLTLTPSTGKPIYSVKALENPHIPVDAETICSNGTTCYFFKNGAITSINITSLFIAPDPPRLFFQQLKAGEKIYSINKEIEIPFADSKSISISFSTLSYGAKSVLCQYVVTKNGKENWVDIDGNINLVHPGFGDYTIKVRAKTASSGYSEPIGFTLRILRPFWATWWFISIAASLALFATGVLIRRRIATMLQKKQRAHEKEIRFIRSEYVALNALMNPHFIFNTLNNVQDLFNKNDQRSANEYLRSFADLIRQNMHNISKELIPLQKEIDLVVNYLKLEQLRFDEFLNYSINITEGLDLSEIMVPPLLIQPLVENSIKHGIYPLQSANGHVAINVREEQSCVHIEVKDNGVGMRQASSARKASHESFGLDNIKKRIEQLSRMQNRKIILHIANDKDENGAQQWTTVTISIPLSN